MYLPKHLKAAARVAAAQCKPNDLCCRLKHEVGYLSIGSLSRSILSFLRVSTYIAIVSISQNIACSLESIMLRLKPKKASLLMDIIQEMR